MPDEQNPMQPSNEYTPDTQLETGPIASPPVNPEGLESQSSPETTESAAISSTLDNKAALEPQSVNPKTILHATSLHGMQPVANVNSSSTGGVNSSYSGDSPLSPPSLTPSHQQNLVNPPSSSEFSPLDATASDATAEQMPIESSPSSDNFTQSQTDTTKSYEASGEQATQTMPSPAAYTATSETEPQVLTSVNSPNVNSSGDLAGSPITSPVLDPLVVTPQVAPTMAIPDTAPVAEMNVVSEPQTTPDTFIPSNPQ
jgi:hypothetical protein